MKLKPTSKLRDPIVRTLHLSTLHMHSLNIHKVKISFFLINFLMQKYSHDAVSVDLIVYCYNLWPGNTKRAIYILQNGLELGAKPKEILETALQSIQGGKSHIFCSEDKENLQSECFFYNIYYYFA